MIPWSKNGGLLSLLGCLLSCLPAQADNGSRHEFKQPCMGTLFRIVIYSANPEEKISAAAKEAFALGIRLDKVFSDYQAGSEVSRFNHAAPGRPMPASPELLGLLAICKDLHDETDGKFDPACGALSRLWRISRRSGKLPSPRALAAAREASGWDRLSIDNGKSIITRLHPGTRLDFGAIGKGYAADRMLQSLRAAGFASASVTAGGDIAAGDAPPGRKGWRIAIRPRGEKNSPAFVIEISNAACSTSGDVEQAVQIGDTLYSHIIDLETGLGQTSQRAAAVIAPSCTRSDALATALCIAGKKGLKMFRAMPGTEAVLFAPGIDGQAPVQTGGFAVFIGKK